MKVPDMDDETDCVDDSRPSDRNPCRHLPEHPYLQWVLEDAELEFILSTRYILAVLPGGRLELFEFREFPEGLASVLAYANETGKPLRLSRRLFSRSLMAWKLGLRECGWLNWR